MMGHDHGAHVIPQPPSESPLMAAHIGTYALPGSARVILLVGVLEASTPPHDSLSSRPRNRCATSSERSAPDLSGSQILGVDEVADPLG